MTATHSPRPTPAPLPNGHTMTSTHSTRQTTSAHPISSSERVRPVSFMRLLRVEARKLVDTRAGRWLLGICALLSGTIAWAAIAWMPDLEFEKAPMVLFNIAITPVSILVPVVAILAATAEWSQRTGLATFALEPRRARVVAAKVIVSCGAGLLAVVVALAVVLAGLGVATLLGQNHSWTLHTPSLAGTALVTVLTMLQASAFGFAMLNTAAAIVSFFVLPIALTIATSVSTRIAEHAEWFDLGAVGMPFMNGTATGSDWAHLASTCAIWIALPMAVGVVRVLRSDLK